MFNRFALAAIATALLLASPADAETTHVVGPGHTLAKISKRYRVSVEAIREANEIAPGQRLKIGQRLVIPDGEGAPKAAPNERPSPRDRRDEQYDSRETKTKAKSAPAKRPGVVTLVHKNEQWTGKTLGRGSKLQPGVADQFRRLLRYGDSEATSHPIDPRLIAMLTQVSDHFGGRPIEVVSGFRPHTEGQHTAHSNHNLGRAVDFVVRGISNQAVRDFCHTLRDVGVGYYPNSSFVHLDVRTASARWVDESGPGEAPRYVSGAGSIKRPKGSSGAIPVRNTQQEESADQ